MVNYVNTVLVSNLASGNLLSAAPKKADAMSKASDDAGKFIIMNCDSDINANKLYVTSAAEIAEAQTIKVGIVTKKNCVLRKPDGSAEYHPIVKWSNEIKAADIKSFSILKYADWQNKNTEDKVDIDLTGMTIAEFNGSKSGKRLIVRITYKDMPHRYRKWTESYEYTTAENDTINSIATNIANMINREYKRARVEASANSGVITLTAMPYDDDDSVDSLSWANKVRFNVNMYYTDPSADGWEANNKHFPAGVTITKTPGEQYPAEAKLVRDRESWAMGYQGILNRGEGTWPIIKPAMETDLSSNYDAITLEFENMYRAADDIQRKTKQTLEIYAKAGSINSIETILKAFVNGVVAQAQPQQTQPQG